MEVPFQMFWGGETDRAVIVQMQATGRRDHEAGRCNPQTRTLEESRLCVFMAAILHRPFIWWNETRPRAWTGTSRLWGWHKLLRLPPTAACLQKHTYLHLGVIRRFSKSLQQGTEFTPFLLAHPKHVRSAP